ncbi:MAG TPA: Xaa-Pro peptidase family protein [Vicinamibacterales bacterium]|nr:Xaa-Pro peptidase family protein [Vicinamibacterales bacterium]
MSHAPTAALKERHRVIRGAVAAAGLDALVVTSLPNVLYLTNFTGSSAIVIVDAERIQFMTDFRYATAIADTRGLAHECPDLDLVLVEGSYDATLAAKLTGSRWRRVGFEASHLTVARHNWLESAIRAAASAGESPGSEREPMPPVQPGQPALPSAPVPPVQPILPACGISLVPTDQIVERARVRKDDYEVATLREAARRLSSVARSVAGEVRRGRSERAVAAAIDWRIREAGFERSAFDTIVASGPQAALPHARPTERTIIEGDLVVLDFGGVYDSYCVDLTRTVVVGKADQRVREVYDAVRAARNSAVAAVAPGRSRFDIDAAARDLLTARGLGDAFGHGTGHGLGIEVHENPRITRRRPDVDAQDEAVAAGMIFTIEPGAYVPGWGGVRIEDDVLVTDGGVEVLTDVTTDLIEV